MYLGTTMTYLALNCSVEDGLGKLVIVLLRNHCVRNYTFRSPSVFSFKKNSAEILNWHKDNVVSLMARFKVDAVVVKKTERTSFFSKPRNSDIFKLYLEGVMLSLAGTIGKPNKHLYKNEIQAILGDSESFEHSIEKLCLLHELSADHFNVRKADIDVTKEALLAVLALHKLISEA